MIRYFMRKRPEVAEELAESDFGIMIARGVGVAFVLFVVRVLSMR